MKKILIIFTLSVLIFSGCTSPMNTATPQTPNYKPAYTYNKVQTYTQPTPEKLANYEQAMRTIAADIPNDPEYQRIAFDTPENKAWFRSLTYKLWDRQITKEQFMAEGLSKYPTHRHEFNFVIKGLSKICS